MISLLQEFGAVKNKVVIAYGWRLVTGEACWSADSQVQVFSAEFQAGLYAQWQVISMEYYFRAVHYQFTITCHASTAIVTESHEVTLSWSLSFSPLILTFFWLISDVVLPMLQRNGQTACKTMHCIYNLPLVCDSPSQYSRWVKFLMWFTLETTWWIEKIGWYPEQQPCERKWWVGLCCEKHS